MKKRLRILIATTLSMMVCLTLTACGLGTDNSQHSHVYETEWSMDGTYHWYACEDSACTETSQKAEHNIENGFCSVCGYEQTEPIPSVNEVSEEQFNAAFAFEGVSSLTVKTQSNAAIINDEQQGVFYSTFYLDENRTKHVQNNGSDESTVYYELFESYAYGFSYTETSGWVRTKIDSTEQEFEGIYTIEYFSNMYDGVEYDDFTYSDGEYVGEKTFSYGENVSETVTVYFTFRFENATLIYARGDYLVDDHEVYDICEFSNYNATEVELPSNYIDSGEQDPVPSNDWAAYFEFDNVTATFNATITYPTMDNLVVNKIESIKIADGKWLWTTQDYFYNDEIRDYFVVYFDGTHAYVEGVIDDSLNYSDVGFFSGADFAMYQDFFKETSIGVFEAEEITVAGVSNFVYSDVKITIVDGKINTIEYDSEYPEGEYPFTQRTIYTFNSWGTTDLNGSTEPSHTCSFVKEVVAPEYLKINATCLSPALYYKSCECGEYGDSTFAVGDIGTCVYDEDDVCEYCGEAKEYALTVYTEDEAGGTVFEGYTVSFDLNGKTGTVPEKQYIDSSNNLIYPIPKESTGKYLFKGWYLEESCVNQLDAATLLTNDVVLYAGWTTLTYYEPTALYQLTNENKFVTMIGNGYNSSGGATYYSYQDLYFHVYTDCELDFTFINVGASSGMAIIDVIIYKNYTQVGENRCDEWEESITKVSAKAGDLFHISYDYVGGAADGIYGYHAQMTTNIYGREVELEGPYGNVKAGSGVYSKGETVVLSFNLTDKYIFNGWYIGDSLLSSELNFNYVISEEDVTIVAETTFGCSYNLKIAELKFLKDAATCDTPAVYYFSCECGAHGDETFEYGEALGCDYGDWVCCGDGTHIQTCSRDENHVQDGVCEGGTASCIKRAICEICQGEWGGLADHTYEDGLCSVCGNCEEHNFIDGVCEVCGSLQSNGLNLVLSADETYYIVKDIGTCEDLDVYIPYLYEQKPVEEIAAQAFYNCNSLTSIMIPSTIKLIGNKAFYGCKGLTKIDFRAENCTNLTSSNEVFYNAGSNADGITVNIGSSVGSIPEYLFNPKNSTSYAPKIKDIKFENVENLSIGKYSFAYCDDLLAIDIPSNVVAIGQSAFENCYSVEKIVIGKDVSSIKGNAFKNCKNLKELNYNAINCTDYYSATYSNGTSVFTIGQACANEIKVVIGDTVQTIPANFLRESSTASNNNRLRVTELIIGSSVETIGDYAFANLYDLETVEFNAVNCADFDSAYRFNKAGKNVGGVTLFVGVQTKKLPAYMFASTNGGDSYVKAISFDVDSVCAEIGQYAFAYDDELIELNFSDNLNKIGNNAFTDCSSLEKVNYYGTLSDWCSINFYSVKSNPLYNGAALYIESVIVKDLVISEDVTTIGKYAFAGYVCLTTVTFKEGVQSINSSAFYGCSSLTEVVIPNSLNSFGYDAFSSATVLEHVRYVGTLEDWCEIDFNNGKSNPLSNGAKLYVNSNEMVVATSIPVSINQIKAYTFYGCTSLSKIELHSGIVSIGNNAFYNCYKLVDVYNCSTNITIESGSDDNGCVAKYSLNAYSNMTDSKYEFETTEDGFVLLSNTYTVYMVNYVGDDLSVVVPSSVTYISAYSFAYNRSLETISIPNGVGRIGAYAFADCLSLVSVNIPETVTDLGRGVFYGCSSLRTINLTESISSIGEKTFYNCSLLETVTVTTNLDVINPYAFYGCDALSSIEGEYVGTWHGTNLWYDWTAGCSGVSLENLLKEYPSYYFRTHERMEALS